MEFGNFVHPEGKRRGDHVGVVVSGHDRRRNRNPFLEESSSDRRGDLESIEDSDGDIAGDIGDGAVVVDKEDKTPRMACGSRGANNTWNDPNDVFVVAPPKKNSWKLADQKSSIQEMQKTTTMESLVCLVRHWTIL